MQHCLGPPELLLPAHVLLPNGTQGAKATAAAKAPVAKAPASKKAAGQPLAPTTSHNVPQQQQHEGGKAIEEIYQKKSQLEHILLRPDTYIGSTEKQQQTLWVHDGERLVYKTITYAPGLFKIFDEILVNAADNKVRDYSMDTIRVDISPVSSKAEAALCAVCAAAVVSTVCALPVILANHCTTPSAHCTNNGTCTVAA